MSNPPPSGEPFTVGIAGYGRMGAAMAARLSESIAQVIVWNRTPEKPRAAGFASVDTPRELALRCPVIISSLFDETALAAVYRGHKGLISGALGRSFIEMSTVPPALQVSLGREITRAGGAFVECPVGGSTGPARAGKLLGLVGGEPADIERIRPVLGKLCGRLEHTGAVGTAAAIKLSINLPLIAFWQALGEALTLARGLDRSAGWLVDLFAESAGAANVLKLKAPAVVEALSGAGTPPTTYSVDTMRKDLRLMLDQASTAAAILPVAEATLRALDKASADGCGGLDCACIPAYWRSNASSARPSPAET